MKAEFTKLIINKNTLILVYLLNFYLEAIMSESLINLIIYQDFGERFAQVVDYILRNGELTLPEIVTGLKIPFTELKHILIILIKHNIIIFYNHNVSSTSDATDLKTDKPEDIRYKISICDILHRLR